MSMSKKDFELVASTIRAELELSAGMFEPHHVSAYLEITEKLAQTFIVRYPNFRASTFLEAAGYNEFASPSKSA